MSFHEVRPQRWTLLCLDWRQATSVASDQQARQGNVLCPWLRYRFSDGHIRAGNRRLQLLIGSECYTRCVSSTISVRARNHMLIAVAAAHNSSYRHRHGAVIVAGGRVLGVGWSKRRNKPTNVSDEHLGMCSVHAEVDALRGIGDLKRATCYVTRLDALQRPTMSRPCDECWQSLIDAGVSRVYWSLDSSTIVSAKLY